MPLESDWKQILSAASGEWQGTDDKGLMEKVGTENRRACLLDAKITSECGWRK